jgi:hypothetical protein
VTVARWSAGQYNSVFNPEIKNVYPDYEKDEAKINDSEIILYDVYFDCNCRKINFVFLEILFFLFLCINFHSLPNPSPSKPSMRP